jgi:tetratricopeptide (TPR) repeat protein
LDVASTYADAGQDSDALSEFQHAASLLSSVGWQETHVSVTLFNNWALELDQIGRPLEAEKIERHLLEIARDDNTTEAVTPMVLNNYAKFLRQLARLDEAADYGRLCGGRKGPKPARDRSIASRTGAHCCGPA